jgi:hypothetical protein
MGHLRKSGFRSGYRRYTVPIIVTMKNLVARPSGLVNEVVLDMIWVKHWEYKSLITFKLLSLEMWKLYGYICLAKHFRKSIHMLVFNKYFYKKKKSKLYFGNRIAVLNHFIWLRLPNWTLSGRLLAFVRRLTAWSDPMCALDRFCCFWDGRGAWFAAHPTNSEPWPA